MQAHKFVLCDPRPGFVWPGLLPTRITPSSRARSGMGKARRDGLCTTTNSTPPPATAARTPVARDPTHAEHAKLSSPAQGRGSSTGRPLRTPKLVSQILTLAGRTRLVRAPPHADHAKFSWPLGDGGKFDGAPLARPETLPATTARTPLAGFLPTRNTPLAQGRGEVNGAPLARPETPSATPAGPCRLSRAPAHADPVEVRVGRCRGSGLPSAGSWKGKRGSSHQAVRGWVGWGRLLSLRTPARRLPRAAAAAAPPKPEKEARRRLRAGRREANSSPLGLCKPAAMTTQLREAAPRVPAAAEQTLPPAEKRRR